MSHPLVNYFSLQTHSNTFFMPLTLSNLHTGSLRFVMHIKGGYDCNCRIIVVL